MIRLLNPNGRATMSDPARPAPLRASSDDPSTKMSETDKLAARMAFNRNKPLEYDPEAALAPAAGEHFEPEDPIVGASTVQEANGSEKVGSGSPVIGTNKTIAPLDRVRVDSSKRWLTTNQGSRLPTTSIP